MSEYRVTFARSAEKELSKLRPPAVTRIFRQIEALADDLRPSGCTKLSGSDALWRIRIGDYRVLYEVDDAERVVDVFAVRHRQEAYR
ncbi:MAG: type II toxin-antitoxin system RelE/ParE family toxin [Bacteroidota bacterium]